MTIVSKMQDLFLSQKVGMIFSQVLFYYLKNSIKKKLEGPDNDYSILKYNNYNTHLFQFSYSSFLQPTIYFEFNMKNNSLKIKNQIFIPNLNTYL